VGFAKAKFKLLGEEASLEGVAIVDAGSLMSIRCGCRESFWFGTYGKDRRTNDPIWRGGFVQRCRGSVNTDEALSMDE